MKSLPTPSSPDHINVDRQEAERLLFWLGIAAAFFIACWSIFFVPMSNDEPNHYHLLACWSHPFSQLDASMARGCDHRYDLTTSFGFTIQRSLQYIGSLPSLIYAPLYFLFPTPLSLYFLGIVFFVSFSFLLSRLTANPLLNFSIILSFFPLSLSFIHDMGPIKFDALLYPIGAFFFQRSLTAARPTRFIYATLLSGMFFLAFEEKPFALYLLPGLVFFYLAFLGQNFKDAVTLLRHSKGTLVFGIGLTLILISTLFFSTLPDGRYYVTSLLQLSHGEGMPAGIFSAGHMSWGEKLFDFILFWPNYAHRFLDLDFIDRDGNSSLSFATFLGLVLPPVALFIASGVALLSAFKAGRITGISFRIVCLSLSCLTTLLVFEILGQIYAAHHFIYVWFPLIVLFVDLLTQITWQWRTGLSILFFIANIIPALWLTQVPSLDETSNERTAIHAYFNDDRAPGAVINYLNWGDHLFQALYGPKNELVVTMSSSDDMKKLFELGQKTNRTIYFVCHIPNPKNSFAELFGQTCSTTGIQETIANALGIKVVLREVLPGLKVWHVYEVTKQG